VVRHQRVHQRGVERLGKPRIGERDRQPFASSSLHRLARLGQMRAEGQDRHVMAFLQHAALADFQHVARLRHLDADALPARIAQRDGTIVMGRGGGHHVHKLRFVGAGHDGHVGQRGR
jgi:hypothetical protein